MKENSQCKSFELEDDCLCAILEIGHEGSGGIDEARNDICSNQRLHI